MAATITPEHLARDAYLYVRQATADQLLPNHESRRRQYALAERARQLGWSNVVVSDDDLGRSGGGPARPGCERLLVAIGERRVGIVLAVAVSRRARNGRDWHTWLELCGLIDGIMADADGLYDARSPNDRLLLGMKGTMSEMELSILRQRSMEALKRKARGGELFLTVAIGYIKVRHHLLQRDSEGSRSAHPRGGACCFRQGRGRSEASPGAALAAPARDHAACRGVWSGGPDRGVEAAGLHYHSPHPDQPDIRRRLGLRAHQNQGPPPSRPPAADQGGRKERDEGQVLLIEHHQGYISWHEFERNQRLITENANGKAGGTRGPLGQGEALRAGLLRSGHCGRKLHVAYPGAGGNTARYPCQGAHLNHGTKRCGCWADRAVICGSTKRSAPK